MTEWIALGLGAVALAAVIGWLKAHREARDLKMCLLALGDEYDKLFIAYTSKPKPVMPPVVDQR